ncbi:MAG: OmpA family protein, partial [Bacteroidia bacterium]
TVKKDSVAFNNTIVKVKEIKPNTPEPQVQIKVAKAEAGKSFVIENIQYNTNSSEIKEESKLILQSFADYLKENPKLKIEIQGHTDNVGNPKDNMALSSNRAYSVKQYLEDLKISGNRITAKGFGSERPIADNKTENGRAKNRRTEFLIIE